MIKKILIANRGEIAVRVIKACKELGILSVAVYSDADKNSLHVRIADEAYHIGPASALESYLDSSKIINLAKSINADAIHPGYGFLSENYQFIKDVSENGIIFIGPDAETVKLMGEKTEARRIMKNSAVPIVPGTIDPITDISEAKKIAEDIGYPIMLKASGGGGGKGMRKVDTAEEFESSFNSTLAEAKKAFNNPDVYIEKFIDDPKHIEVQILSDTFDNHLHLFERECSVQRRHQKIIEEAPSPSLDNNVRNELYKAAVEAARAVKYKNAGTIEFLLDKNRNFYFLEMNTRLQVEHPVSEMISGIDLVKEQIRIAEGKEISFSQNDISINGHSIECRIYAEDCENNFSPSIGTIGHHRLPSGPGIRIERGIEQKTEVSLYYDPMLSKIISHGRDREEAIVRANRALSEYQISGVVTNISLCKWILKNKKFLDGSYTIQFIEEEFLPLLPTKWKEDWDKELTTVAEIFSSLIYNKKYEFNPAKLDYGCNNNWGSNLDD